ncbi:MAG: hypothetical protein HWN65_07170 [Candidatus Helarchaeota archaeon]|nr:hypothetical protein [Candidatus Helarchaeota archaeon]
MAKDGTTLTIGLIYITLIGLVWIFLFARFEYCYPMDGCYNLVYFITTPGLTTLFGALFLVPSFILALIFITTSYSTTTGKVAFGFGVFGWIFGIIGNIDILSYYTNVNYVPTLMLIFFLGLAVFGTIVFVRVWKFDDFARDRVKFIWGIVNLSLMGLVWIFWIGGILWSFPIFIMYNDFFLGVFFYVPAFILNAVFFAQARGITSGKVGFGLGVPGWVLCLIGIIFEIRFPHFYTDVVSIIFYLIITSLIILSGIILFTRVYKAAEYAPAITEPIRQPTTTIPSVSPARMPPGPPCPDCSRATRHIAQYNRYYCDHCQKYI